MYTDTETSNILFRKHLSSKMCFHVGNKCELIRRYLSFCYKMKTIFLKCWRSLIPFKVWMIALYTLLQFSSLNWSQMLNTFQLDLKTEMFSFYYKFIGSTSPLPPNGLESKKIGVILETALQRAPILHMKAGQLDKAISRYR